MKKKKGKGGGAVVDGWQVDDCFPSSSLTAERLALFFLLLLSSSSEMKNETVRSRKLETWRSLSWCTNVCHSVESSVETRRLCCVSQWLSPGTTVSKRLSVCVEFFISFHCQKRRRKWMNTHQTDRQTTSRLHYLNNVVGAFCCWLQSQTSPSPPCRILRGKLLHDNPFPCLNGPLKKKGNFLLPPSTRGPLIFEHFFKSFFSSSFALLCFALVTRRKSAICDCCSLSSVRYPPLAHTREIIHCRWREMMMMCLPRGWAFFQSRRAQSPPPPPPYVHWRAKRGE